jgi:pilus assembly protein CpaC
VAIIVILVAAPQAQGPAPAFVAAAGSGAPAPAAEVPTDVDLLVGRSTVLNVGAAIARVSLTVPDIADAMVTAPSQLLIHGKQPGTISLFVWDRAGAIKTFEVKVRRDLTPLSAHLKQLFPGESITVMGSGKDVVISGTVSSKYVIEKAADVAGGYVEKKENVVNLLQQQEGVASNQVMLRVRFAEVSRSAMTELGAALFTGPGGFHDYVARSTTQQFAAPSLEGTRESIQGVDKWGGGRDTVTATGGKMEFSDFLNLFVFNNRYNIGTVVRALQDKGLFQSLAEPNLVATNGKEASFLAGGEFPIPVVQGGQMGNSVTIMFKEFGVRLNFTPTVLGGDLINLKVRPEVSALDFNNAIVIEGFRVPALTTRRTETEVELRDGQTFAIAGLMNNTVADSMRKIPGIGDIPILGWLFKSKAIQKQQTELVVMITPHIVRRGQPGVSEGLPSLVEPYLGAPKKTHPNPDAYVGSPRYPVNQNAPAPTPAPAPAPAPAPQHETAPQNGPAAEQQQSAAPAPQQLARPAAGAVNAVVAEPVQPAQELPVPQAVTPPQVVTPAAEDGQQPEAAPLTKEQREALEQAREEERKAAERAAKEDARKAEEQRKALEAAEKARIEQEKRDAEQRKAEARVEEKRRAEQAKREEALRKQAQKLDEERRKREAEVARKNQEQARKQAEEEQKRQKALDEAALRLKQAQEAYQQEMAKSSKGGN